VHLFSIILVVIMLSDVTLQGDRGFTGVKGELVSCTLGFVSALKNLLFWKKLLGFF